MERSERGKQTVIPEPERHQHHRAARARPPIRQPSRIPLRRLLRVASVACGIQFGWALQLSLLTPYVQELGIPHAWASVIWLCGPLSGLLVQPLVGLMSDRSTSRFGRRRPFILAGALSIVVAVLIIGHSADIGWLLGDRGDSRPRAVGAFVFGFWILDVANNMTQGPCRALLADLTGKDHRRTRVANAYFSLFMAIAAQEVPLVSIDRSTPSAEDGPGTSDWMGREIYGGKPNEGQNYSIGVRMGSFGLMLNSVVLGITSVLMEKLCSKWGAGFVWGISNILMALCFLAMLVVAFVVKSFDFEDNALPPNGIVIAALVIFAILGVPLSITYSVPYALISTRIESLGLGQGLSMGVLNLAIVIPQVVVSLGSGPWDQLFGGGNSPAFAVAAVAALASGLIAILAIPRSSPQKPRALI
nr:sucrose transport protein suc4 [Quercus suber]